MPLYVSAYQLVTLPRQHRPTAPPQTQTLSPRAGGHKGFRAFVAREVAQDARVRDGGGVM